MKTLSLLVASIVAVYLQWSFVGFRPWFGTQLDLLPVLAVYAGMRGEMREVALVAILGGLLFDSLSVNPLGLSVIPLVLIGWLVYRNRDILLHDQAYAQILLGAVACGGAPILQLVLLSLTQRPPDPVPLVKWSSLWQWTLLAMAGGFVAPVVFFILDKVNLSLNYQPIATDDYSNRRILIRGRH